MTQIKKLKTSEGVQFYPQTHTKAVIDDNGYTAESRLQAMQDEINQAQMAIGAVPSDLAPTEDSTNWVTSGGVYNAMQGVQSELNELEGKISPQPIYNADNMNCDFPNNNGSYIYTRYRMGFEIDSVPQTVRVSNFPSGYTFSIQGYSSQADAFNSTLSPIDYGDWGETEHTFTNQSIRYIALNIKNNSNTSMSNSDTANFSNIIVTLIVDDVTIDDVPMQGSMNLVRSNGIYDAVSPIPSIQNNVNELNLTLYGGTETVNKGLEDAEIVLINSSLQEVTSVTSAFRLRLLYQLPEGASFNIRCTLYSGVAVVLYSTRDAAVKGDTDYLENYTNGYSTSEVIGETGYNGYLSISWKNSNGSNFTQSDYDSFMSNVQISITSTDIEDNSVISRLTNLENGGHKRSLSELLSNNINVISHIGGGSFYGAVAPMNSMWSANLAARMGMRCCEFDIVFTSDDVPICCHDLNISTSGNNEFVKKDGTAITGSTPIGSLTYQQIIDTYEYRQGFVGYKQISTLFDVLKVYRDNNIIPCLEVKNPATSMTSTRYNLILNALHDYAGDDFMIVMFDVDNAIALRNLDENALIGISDQVFNQSMITTAKQYNFFCGLYLNVITSTIIENFKSEGVELYGWTVSTDVNAALKLGLRYFICDYIAEPQTTAGVVDTYVSNALDFSNITHTGTVTDNHLVLVSGQTATITSSVTHWLNSVEAHIIIKGVCTISVGSTNFAVNNADFEEYLVLLREYNKTLETITINGTCEIASIESVFKSY